MKSNITNKQIMFMLYCIIVGYGVIDLPKSIAEIGGTGGWLSIIIATMLFIVITYIIAYMQYEYEGKTLYEYSEQLVGKFVTYIFVIIYIVYFFMYFTMIMRMYGETIRITILPKTPVIYIKLLFYIVVGYALMKGIESIARLCEIYAFCSIVFSILFSLILFSQGKIVNITPMFIPEDFSSYFKNIIKMFNPFLGMEILVAIPVNKNDNPKLPKCTALMVGFIGILYIYIAESVISVVGVESIINTKASIFDVAKGIDISYLEFLRRLDGIYIFAWTLNIVCAMSLWGYCIVTFTNKILKSKRYKLIVICFLVLSFILGQIPKTINEAEKIITYASYLGVLTSLIIPSILILITKVKKNDKKI